MQRALVVLDDIFYCSVGNGLDRSLQIGILSKLRDRRGNKADDDQRYTERNNLPKNVIQRHNEIHKTFICYKTGNNTDRYAQRQPKRQAFPASPDLVVTKITPNGAREP